MALLLFGKEMAIIVSSLLFSGEYELKILDSFCMKADQSSRKSKLW